MGKDGGEDVCNAGEGGGVAEVEWSVCLERLAKNHDGVDVGVKECLRLVT